MFSFKRNQQRHKILGILYKKIDASIYKTRWPDERAVTLKEIEEKVGINRDTFISLHSVMFDRDEVERGLNGEKEEVAFIKQNGMTAYKEKKYLKESWSNFNTFLYDRTKWVVPLLALTIAALTYFKAKRIEKSTSEQFQKLSQKVDTLEARIKPIK